jgi:hypothetical protein
MGHEIEGNSRKVQFVTPFCGLGSETFPSKVSLRMEPTLPTYW